MADQQKSEPTGPVDHLIPVHCDMENATVEITEPKAVIRPGDRVVWECFGLPEGWSPWIEFRPQESGTPFLGPFADLTQSAVAVWGLSRKEPGVEGRQFSYRVAIQKGIGMGWASGAAVIHSQAGVLSVAPMESGTLHQFTVTPEAGAPAPALQVSPIGVIIQAGDTVEWVFEGIPADPNTWRPQIQFSRYDGSGSVPNLYLGPFTSLTTGRDLVRGTGNNWISGTYYFDVGIVQVSNGELLYVGSGDPAIDNRGSSADPTSGG